MFKEKIKELRAEQVVYVDESGIDKYIYRTHGRAPRGVEVRDTISGLRYQRESFVAGQCNGKIIAPMIYKGSCNTTLFNCWVEKCLIPVLKPGQIIVLDNATFHKSSTTKELIEGAGCKLLFLPPYSPDLNPIEKTWANIKDGVREFLRIGLDLTTSIIRSFRSVKFCA